MHIAPRVNALRGAAVLLGATVGFTIVKVRTPTATPVPAPDVPITITSAATEATRESAPPVDPARLGELSFVIEVGGSWYMNLADVENDDIAHGAVREATSGEANLAAIAKVREVPEAYRVWLDRRVNVENRCEATVSGFAVISRLTGDPGYAGLAGKSWTAETIFDNGAKIL